MRVDGPEICDFRHATQWFIADFDLLFRLATDAGLDLVVDHSGPITFWLLLNPKIYLLLPP